MKTISFVFLAVLGLAGCQPPSPPVNHTAQIRVLQEQVADLQRQLNAQQTRHQAELDALVDFSKTVLDAEQAAYGVNREIDLRFSADERRLTRLELITSNLCARLQPVPTAVVRASSAAPRR